MQQAKAIKASNRRKTHWKHTWKLAVQNRALYLMILPAFLYIAIFHYWPMYGVQIAFRNFNFADGITGSPWVGLKWFRYFFKSNNFKNVVGNTLILNFYNLLAGFPVPIILALVMNSIPGKRFKRVAQTITYLPHFISVVVLVGLMSCMFSVNSGWVNTIVKAFGGTPAYVMGEAKYFRHVYVWSGVWQEMGWNSIIYLAALTSIDSGLHEAAMIDGAGKLRRIWHIDLAELRPTVLVLFIMSLGNVINVGYEKVLLMQNSLNTSTSEVLSTYVYKIGLINSDYGFSTAVGLFNSLVSMVLLLVANRVAKKLAGYSIW